MELLLHEIGLDGTFIVNIVLYHETSSQTVHDKRKKRNIKT